MKTILALAVGFWIGREVYIRYDRQIVLDKEKQLKDKMKNLLKDGGWSTTEINQTLEELTK